MPVPTADDIEDTAAQIAGDGVAVTEQDGVKVTVLDPLKLQDVARRNRPVGNAWNRTGVAQAVPTGRMGNVGGCE